MTRSLLLLLVFSLSACVASATTSGFGAGGAPPPASGVRAATGPAVPAYAGPRTIKKGDRISANLRLGETHVYRIELAATEQVTFALEGDSGPNGRGSGCGNWGWDWKSPEGKWVNGNPLPLAPNADGSGARRERIPVAAMVAGAGDMVGLGGVWSLELRADPANCAGIRYAFVVQ